MDLIEEVTALSLQVNSDALVDWNDQKRKDFCETFSQRARVTRYLLIKTAEVVAEVAKRRHFISDKHDLKQGSVFDIVTRDKSDTGNGWTNYKVLGGRNITDLDAIATERANEILSNLPPLATAVQLINPKIAAAIETRDKLFEKGKLVMAAAKELSGAIDMADLDQDMTLADFRKTIKDRDAKRRQLLSKLDDIGTEGRELENRINKFLYTGLPGLSDAVVKVIKDHYEQATAFDTLNRRVGERVQFGDSDAALDLLHHFEEDETKVSESIKEQFENAMQALKLNAPKGNNSKATSKKLKGK